MSYAFSSQQTLRSSYISWTWLRDAGNEQMCVSFEYNSNVDNLYVELMEDSLSQTRVGRKYVVWKAPSLGTGWKFSTFYLPRDSNIVAVQVQIVMTRSISNEGYFDIRNLTVLRCATGKTGFGNNKNSRVACAVNVV